jgi:WD40 repeat protein
VPADKETDKQAPFVALWDLSTGKEIKALPPKDADFAHALALSPDASMAVLGSGTRLAQWNLTTGQVTDLTKLDKKAANVASLIFVPGSKQLLTNSGRGIQLWDVDKPRIVRTYAEKGETLHYVAAVAPGGTRFVTVHDWNSLTLWDTQTGKPMQQTNVKQEVSLEGIAGVHFSDDGKTVLASILQPAHFPQPSIPAIVRIIAWDTESNKVRWSKSTYYAGAAPMRVQKDKLVVGGGPNYLDVLSIKDGKLLERHGAHKGPVHAIGMSKDGDLISAGSEGAMITWRDGNQVSREMPHSGSVTALAFNKDRTRWLSAGNDLVVRSWPPDASRTATFKKTHTGPITSLAIASAGNWAASGSGDRTVRTWFVPTGEVIAVFEGHSESVNAVAISPDGRWLASGSDDATIKLWPVKDGKLDADRESIVLEKHTKPVTCLMFTPDGKRLLSGSQDQRLMVWNWQKGSMDFMINGHKNWITSIAMLDEQTVLTASDDLTIAAWNLADGMELGRLDFGKVGDCPRCLAPSGPDRFVVGTSSWLIYEFQLTLGKTKGGKNTSSK